MATQNIRTALARIKTVEEGLSITDPETLAVARVYTLVPKKDHVLETPCFIHGVTLGPVEHFNEQRTQHYFVASQFMHDNPDLDRAQDIAAAFLDKWLDAFSADLCLNGTIAGPIRLRGNDPTIARLEFAGLAFTGLDLVIEVLMHEAVTVGI